MSRRWSSLAITGLVTLVVGSAGSHVSGQSARRTPTTLAALNSYTSFFHRQPVVVVAEASGDLQDVFLTDGEHRIRVLNVAPPAVGATELIEIDAVFWDVGRLEPNDARVADQEIRALSQRLFGKPWPASGELPLLIADDTRPAAEPDTVTLQSLALEPTRYLGQTVEVTGRFRGRNLHGDLPEAPGTSPDDFVLQSGAAAAWVVGKKPRGEGFDLDVMARVDTGRWLQITGVVSGTNRLVAIEASKIVQVERPTVLATPTLAEDRTEPGPSPEVIFSTPTQDDTGVATDALVRFQFSRDMDPESFDGHVEVAYFGTAPSASEDARPEFTVEYRARNRVLNVTLTEPLKAYSTVEVVLSEGALATDGATLVPHELRFSTGSS